WKNDDAEIVNSLDLCCRHHGNLVYLNAGSGMALSSETGLKSWTFDAAKLSSHWGIYLVFSDGVLGRSGKGRETALYDLASGKIKQEGNVITSGCTAVT